MSPPLGGRQVPKLIEGSETYQPEVKASKSDNPDYQVTLALGHQLDEKVYIILLMEEL